MTDEHRSKSRIPALVIAGLLLLAVCVPVTGYFTWREQAGELQRQSEESLAAIADLKAHQISAWLTERRGDVETLHDNPLLPQAADAWFRDGDRERFEMQAIPLKKLARYRNGSQLAHHQTAQGLVTEAVFIGKFIQIERFFDLINFQQSIQQKRTIWPADHLRLGNHALSGRNFPNDRL
jgi:hypothetical protein